MMQTYALTLLPASSDAELRVRWCFDFPVVNQAFECAAPCVVVLRGWALPRGGGSVDLLTRADGVIRSYPLNVCRPDVIGHVLGVDSDGHPKLCCGFHLSVPVCDRVDIGFVVDWDVFWVCAVATDY